MNTSETMASHVKRNVAVQLSCLGCSASFGTKQILNACTICGGPLEYVFEGTYDGTTLERSDQWRFFELMPLLEPSNIISLDEGNSSIIELTELSDVLRGARLYLKLDSQKNPTGTFKDREAALILSKCRENQLDNLVFYSTCNTGRAYTHYAAHLNLTTYFFMPRQCQYKNTQMIRKNKNNFIILVDAEYPQIAPYAKAFAKENNLNLIAPLHDRTESYATIAYEQFLQMPQCDFFVQPIASGMGPIGFLRGHKNLVKFGLERREDIPRIVCVQSEETNFMFKSYLAGKVMMTREDLPADFPDNLFEPTLNSTNPVNNYPSLYQCLKDSSGTITDANPSFVMHESKAFVEALERRKLLMRFDLEKSMLIGYAGIVKLVEEGQIGKNDRVLLLATGRGNDTSGACIQPDITIHPSNDDPVSVKKRLNSI